MINESNIIQLPDGTYAAIIKLGYLDTNQQRDIFLKEKKKKKGWKFWK